MAIRVLIKFKRAKSNVLASGFSKVESTAGQANRIRGGASAAGSAGCMAEWSTRVPPRQAARGAHAEDQPHELFEQPEGLRGPAPNKNKMLALGDVCIGEHEYPA